MKGSSLKRNALNKRTVLTKRFINKMKFSITLKDNEIRTMLKVKPELICMRLDQRMKLIKTLDNDSKFLAKLGLMDYSLLLIIEELPVNGKT